VDEELKDLRALLTEATLATGQGSYERRSPKGESVPLLMQVRSRLIRYMENREPTADSWRLLAHAEECLLHYAAARRCLERAIALSGMRDKKDLKKLALYQQNEEKWKDLILTPTQLKELGDFLEQKQNEALFERSFKWTKTWLQLKGISDAESVLEGLRRNGG